MYKPEEVLTVVLGGLQCCFLMRGLVEGWRSRSLSPRSRSLSRFLCSDLELRSTAIMGSSSSLTDSDVRDDGPVEERLRTEFSWSAVFGSSHGMSLRRRAVVRFRVAENLRNCSRINGSSSRGRMDQRVRSEPSRSYWNGRNKDSIVRRCLKQLKFLNWYIQYNLYLYYFTILHIPFHWPFQLLIKLMKQNSGITQWYLIKCIIYVILKSKMTIIHEPTNQKKNEVGTHTHSHVCLSILSHIICTNSR